MTTTQTPESPARPRPPIDPRIRERLIEVRRAQGRRRLRVIVVALATIVALLVAWLGANSPFLDVDHMQVRGTHNLTSAEVRQASKVHAGDPLLFVDTSAVAKRVERLPWVERASVQRVFPSTLRLTITEYTPTAFLRDGNDIVLFAATGRVIARVSQPPANVVEIRGAAVAPKVGELLSPPEAANVVPRLPNALAQQVVAIDIGGVGIALVVAQGGAIRLGNADDLDAKAAAALAVLAQHGPGPFQYLDVSTPGTPILRG